MVTRNSRSKAIRKASLVVAIATVALATSAPAFATMNDPWTQQAHYVFEYRVDFSEVKVDDDDVLRVWAPYPMDTPHQKVLSATLESPWPHTIQSDRSGNRIVYLEGKGAPDKELVMRFTVTRGPSDGIPAEEAKPNTPLDPQRYLTSARLIPLSGVIQELAERESQGLTSDQEKVRKFYDYVVENMRYNKEGTGWGNGDAIWACENKRGNCTDFHSLFIGMARSQKIPARFVIGFPIPSSKNDGEIGGYHCWAEFFQVGRGWVPVDASEANKAGKPDAYFGVIPNDRIEFTVGRDLTLTPGQDGDPLNYFIFPYAEVDGKPVPKKSLKTAFRFERVKP